MSSTFRRSIEASGLRQLRPRDKLLRKVLNRAGRIRWRHCIENDPIGIGRERIADYFLIILAKLVGSETVVCHDPKNCALFGSRNNPMSPIFSDVGVERLEFGKSISKEI